MRVVAGKHRGRTLIAPKGKGLRPTAGAAREGLFNILIHGRAAKAGAQGLAGARVLEAFAGTGAFAFEAISRGAGSAVLLDTDPTSLEAATANAEALGETDKVTLIKADATRPPSAPAAEAAAIAFLDPPYGSGLGPEALGALATKGWLATGALCIVEVAAKEPFTPPDGFEVIEERRFGAGRFVFLRWGK
jgi:16S rRNA (guanine966-N2)-methyltransferase